MEKKSFFREIVLAIEEFKDDIIKYPIFFLPSDITYLETERAIENISSKFLNEEYFPLDPIRYSIPYDIITTRDAYYLNIEDLIIRYMIKNQIDKRIKLYTNSVNVEKFKVFCIIDIYDCYRQITSQLFIDTVKSKISFLSDNYIDFFKKCICVYDNDYYREIGLIVGLRPDDYFAELFLSILHSDIISYSECENISRKNDEFLVCANSIKELRDIVAKIIFHIREKYNLYINKSKNFTYCNTEYRKITRTIPFEEEWLYSSPSCPPPMFPRIFYKEVNYNSTFKYPTNRTENIRNIKDIKSYKESIEYLKEISPEIEKIEHLAEAYSPYSLLGEWTSSTPIEEKLLRKEIKFDIVMNPMILDNLETILYRFPKSQYFSALAIKNICIYAKNMKYSYLYSCKNDDNNAYITEGYVFSEYNSKNASLLCEKANSILLNALRSENIFSYQKYLIVRELFLDKKTIDISFENYEIEIKPFKKLFKDVLEKILNNASQWERETPLIKTLDHIMITKNIEK